MSIRSELHEMIEKRGGTPPKFGGIAAALDELNKLPSGVTSWNDLTDKPFGEMSLEEEVAADLHPTVAFFEDSEFGCYSWQHSSTPYYYTHKAGDKVRVIFNGAEREYSLERYSVDGTPYLVCGNKSIVGLGEDTGEEYCVVILETYDPQTSITYRLCKKDDSAVYLGLYVGYDRIVPVPSIYLPSGHAVEDAAGETVTAAEFNRLLNSLRNAGYLNWT